MNSAYTPNSHRQTVVLPVRLSAGNGSSLVVDALSPADNIEPVWHRRAWVRAVSQVHLGPIREGALYLDEAAAMAEMGDGDSAISLTIVASVLVDQLVELAQEKALDPATYRELTTILAHVSAAARTTNAPSHLIAQIDQWRQQLSATAAGPRWSAPANVESASTAVLLGSTEQASPERNYSDLAVSSGSVDLAHLPPRIVASDPAGDEVLVEYTMNNDEPESAIATAALAPGVDPTCREVDQLRLVTFTVSGHLRSIHRMHPEGDAVVAHIDDKNVLREATYFAVVSADRGIVGLARDARSVTELTMNSLVRHAWTAARLAAVGLPTDTRKETYGHRAMQCVAEARDRNVPDREFWNDCYERLDTWVTALQQGRFSSGIAARPLLAELIAVNGLLAE